MGTRPVWTGVENLAPNGIRSPGPSSPWPVTQPAELSRPTHPVLYAYRKFYSRRYNGRSVKLNTLPSTADSQFCRYGPRIGRCAGVGLWEHEVQFS